MHGEECDNGMGYKCQYVNAVPDDCAHRNHDSRLGGAMGIPL